MFEVKWFFQLLASTLDIRHAHPMGAGAGTAAWHVEDDLDDEALRTFLAEDVARAERLLEIAARAERLMRLGSEEGKRQQLMAVTDSF